MFKFLKKNAIINISEIVIDKLIAKPFATALFSFLLMVEIIGLYSIIMPNTLEKLIRKLKLNTIVGLNK